MSESEEPRTYEAASERLEEIIQRLDSGEAGLRETLDLCAEGKELVEWCAAELDEVAGDLRELRLDELVERLEAERPREAERPGEAERAREAERPTEPERPPAE